MSGYNYNRPPHGQSYDSNYSRGGQDSNYNRGRYPGNNVPLTESSGSRGGGYSEYRGSSGGSYGGSSGGSYGGSSGGSSGGSYGGSYQRQSSDSYRRETSQPPAPYHRPSSYGHGAQASPSAARGEALPNKVYEIVGKVLLVQQYLDCGIIELEGGANRKAFCFFRGKDVITNSKPEDKLTDKVQPGSVVKANARLMDASANVPYLASTVWSEGIEVGNEAINKIFNPPDAEDEKKYREIANDLSYQLKSGKDDEDIRLVHSKSKEHPRGAYGGGSPSSHRRSRSRSPGGYRRRSRSPASQRGSYPRGRSRSRSPGQQRGYNRRSPDERKRQRSPKDYTPPSPDTDAPKRMRPDSYGGPATPFVAPHTVWQVKDVETLDANSQSLVEEHDAKTGKSATIVKYNNEESGILSCGGEAKVVMFHVNQMWVFQSGIGWAQFREIYPTSELKAMFSPNSKIKCNIKRVDGGQIKFQATAVWLDGAPPPEYRTKEMMDDTQRICSSSKYSTGYVHYLNGPQTGGMDAIPREGVIQEFLSLETGLVRLVDRDCAVVLFNLDQVWIRRGVHSSLLKDDDRKILPQNYIPAGTRVIVTMRPIPAHKFSQLKYQAIYVCKQERPGDVGLTKEFQQMYNSRQVRIDLGWMLHEHHDNFKRLAQLSKIKTLPTTTEMNLVPVVLNTLPVGGVALVIEADNGIMGHDMGLIKVAVPSSSQNMYVLFHLEDVFNTEGLPAIADQELTLESIINKNVDLIARSICPNDNSRDILGIVRKINERHPNAVIPVLQAVAVFIKNEVTGSFNPSKAPLPTYLRTDPKSFNSEQPGAAYYINYLLKSELDRKVMEFMEYSPESITQLLPSVLNPYLSNPATIPAIKDHIPAKKVRSLKMVDHIGASDVLYGTFDPTEHYPQDDLPQIITSLPCRVKLLHRDKWKASCGLIEFSIPDVEYKSVAFFHVGDVVTSKRTFGDLVKVLPANITEQVKLHAYLIDKESKIPYIATAVWIESEQSTDPPGVATQDRSELWTTVGKEILQIWGDGVYDHPPMEDRQNKRMIDDRKMSDESKRPRPSTVHRSESSAGRTRQKTPVYNSSQRPKSAKPVSRQSGSRLPLPRAGSRANNQNNANIANIPKNRNVAESGGGSDESCCSAESSDFLEACIASAMPSKTKVRSVSGLGPRQAAEGAPFEPNRIRQTRSQSHLTAVVRPTGNLQNNSSNQSASPNNAKQSTQGRPNAPGKGSSLEPPGKITLLKIKTDNNWGQGRQVGTLSLERGGSKMSKRCISNYFPNKEDGSFVPCGEGCMCCQFSDPATEIVSKMYPTTVHIKGQISCKSKNLLYKLDCKRCESLTPGLNDSFIGETSMRVRTRLAFHLANSQASRLQYGSVAKHFSSENHTIQDMKITPFMKCRSKVSLKKKERCYQHIIGSYPFGMNNVNH